VPRWIRIVPIFLPLLLSVEAAAAAGLFGWFGEDGAMTLRSTEDHVVLGRVSPGLYGPDWAGFEARAEEGSPKQVGAGCWPYAGSLVPNGQQGTIDYSLAAESTATGVELHYEFVTRGQVSLNALYLRFEVPVWFAAGGRASLPGKELILPVSYRGDPSVYFGTGQAVRLAFAGAKAKLTVSSEAEIELEDGREWNADTFALSFHLFHSDLPRTLPPGSSFEQTLLVEVEGMKKVVFEPTIKSRTDTTGWFAFEMPRDVPREGEVGFQGAVDFSGSVERPAGKHGFLEAKGEHFVFEDGTPVKFWGVNLDSGAGLPDKAHAPFIARRMAQLGINIARFTLDGPAPRGLIAADRDTTQDLDPEMLDRLDYFISCLRERGIYVRLDLMHYRAFKPADGVDAPARTDGEGHWCGGPAMFYQPRVEELHKAFAARLLLHENPYTRLRYVDDPGLAFVGIVNENSIFFYPEKMTESGRRTLDRMFSEWQEAHPDGTRLRFLAELERGYYERMHAYLRDIGVKTSIACSNMLMNAAEAALEAEVGDHVEFNIYFDHPHADWRRIWNKPMLGRRAGIFAPMAAASVSGKPYAITEVNFCNTSYRMEAPLLTAAYASLQDWDAILWWDYHASWGRAGKYEEFLGATAMFTIKDNPMLLAQFGAASVAFRNGYVSPARTSIDVLVTDDHGFEEPNWVWGQGWSDLRPGTPFAVFPMISRVRSRYPAVAAPKADVTVQAGSREAEDRSVITLAKPSEDGSADAEPVWRAVRERAGELGLPEMPEPGATTLVSDTGELSWDTANGLMTVDAPGLQAVIGFIAGKRFQFGDFALSFAPVAPEKPQAPFASVSLCATDGNPLRESSRILLTLAGRAEDTGQVWEEGPEGDFAATAGQPPVLAEPLHGRLTWAGRNLRAFALTASGRRAKEALVEKEGAGEALSFGSDQTMWYELVPADEQESAEGMH
jgi:hypothetical protein